MMTQNEKMNREGLRNSHASDMKSVENPLQYDYN